jgi:acetolactate synthase-1/2/3 large subunit/acetolactate synthase-like protein
VAFDNPAGCTLEYTEYDAVARALGCEGFVIESTDEIAGVLQEAKKLNKEGKSVLINAKIGKSDFRKGSLSA